MQRLINVHCKDLQNKNNWKIKSSKPSDYMISIVEETKKLYKVLGSVLDKTTIQIIFSQVFAMFNTSLVDYFTKLRLKEIGKLRLYQDIEHLINSLGSLEGLKEVVKPLDVLKDFFKSQFKN
eukprot:TRINITY_DN2489_c0_g1_i2.p1 TRINITY_DN2489_c0_g1~~TRINITY_DN2489_c0_g1_i2.p1  ORF type:complete len:122 (+),score=20.31 TRINITY_DN2489_c0_g1_i2:334-699(+)